MSVRRIGRRWRSCGGRFTCPRTRRRHTCSSAGFCSAPAAPGRRVDALKISIWSADSAPARIALGETYLKLEDAAAARTELERALALDPASPEAKRILSTIR